MRRVNEHGGPPARGRDRKKKLSTILRKILLSKVSLLTEEILFLYINSILLELFYT